MSSTVVAKTNFVGLDIEQLIYFFNHHYKNPMKKKISNIFLQILMKLFKV